MLRRTFLRATAAAAALFAFRGQRRAFAAGSTGVTASDPLLAPWTGAHGGFPPFDKIRAAAIKPALLKGMDLERAELAALIANKEAPTFTNTIVALENAG